ncbi:MAG: pyridoxamine 5'-phosphate oxidase [Cryobacterium sp.]|nr:pyridoxamine 5'-phosphate oxidase [Oligoflexia bacterium]
MTSVPFQNPYDFFSSCFDQAKAAGLPQHDSMVLITATKDARPSGRMVLLKGVVFNQDFRFFTNYESRKAGELIENPRAQLLFYWPHLGRQIRVEGAIEKLSAEDSGAYWNSRGRGSQIGAVASEQSHPLDSYEAMETRVAELTRSFEGQPIPRPERWGGFALKAEYFEFWEDRVNRLHERFTYQREAGKWKIGRLWP